MTDASQAYAAPTLAPDLVELVATADGGRIHCGEWLGDEPTFVFCPGLTAQHLHVSGIAVALQRRMRVIGVDLRGRGLSSAPVPGQHGMARHAEDVLACMDALGIERAIVGGHSMGAYVATAVASLAPDRVSALVLLDGGVFLNPEGTPPEALAAGVEETIKPMLARFEARYDSPAQYIEAIKAEPFFKDGWGPIAETNYLREACHVDGRYGIRGNLTACMEDLRDAVGNPATAERITGVRCPVLGLGAAHGFTHELDPVLGRPHADFLAERLDDFEFRVIPNCTHSTQILSEAGARAVAEELFSYTQRQAR